MSTVLLCCPPKRSMKEECFKALLPIKIKFLHHKCNLGLTLLPHALYNQSGAIPLSFDEAKPK